APRGPVVLAGRRVEIHGDGARRGRARDVDVRRGDSAPAVDAVLHVADGVGAAARRVVVREIRLRPDDVHGRVRRADLPEPAEEARPDAAVAGLAAADVHPLAPRAVRAADLAL